MAAREQVRGESEARLAQEMARVREQCEQEMQAIRTSSKDVRAALPCPHAAEPVAARTTAVTLRVRPLALCRVRAGVRAREPDAARGARRIKGTCRAAAGGAASASCDGTALAPARGARAHGAMQTLQRAHDEMVLERVQSASATDALVADLRAQVRV